MFALLQVRIMRRAFAGVIVSATLGTSACSADLPKPADPDAKSVDAIHAQGRALVPLHERKRPPRQGDWLERSVEAGQTLDQYRASSPNRPCGARTTLYVQPLGPFTPEQARLLDAVKHLLERFYGLPVRELPTLGLEAIPTEAKRVHNTLGPQVHSLTVLNLLKPRR